VDLRTIANTAGNWLLYGTAISPSDGQDALLYLFPDDFLGVSAEHALLVNWRAAPSAGASWLNSPRLSGAVRAARAGSTGHGGIHFVVSQHVGWERIKLSLLD